MENLKGKGNPKKERKGKRTRIRTAAAIPIRGDGDRLGAVRKLTDEQLAHLLPTLEEAKADLDEVGLLWGKVKRTRDLRSEQHLDRGEGKKKEQSAFE
jgi:hypothetical protein